MLSAGEMNALLDAAVLVAKDPVVQARHCSTAPKPIFRKGIKLRDYFPSRDALNI